MKTESGLMTLTCEKWTERRGQEDRDMRGPIQMQVPPEIRVEMAEMWCHNNVHSTFWENIETLAKVKKDSKLSPMMKMITWKRHSSVTLQCLSY